MSICYSHVSWTCPIERTSTVTGESYMSASSHHCGEIPQTPSVLRCWCNHARNAHLQQHTTLSHIAAPLHHRHLHRHHPPATLRHRPRSCPPAHASAATAGRSATTLRPRSDNAVLTRECGRSTLRTLLRRLLTARRPPYTRREAIDLECEEGTSHHHCCHRHHHADLLDVPSHARRHAFCSRGILFTQASAWSCAARSNEATL